MAWRRSGDKPLSEPVMAYLSDVYMYMRHSAAVSYWIQDKCNGIKGNTTIFFRRYNTNYEDKSPVLMCYNASNIRYGDNGRVVIRNWRN